MSFTRHLIRVTRVGSYFAAGAVTATAINNPAQAADFVCSLLKWGAQNGIVTDEQKKWVARRILPIDGVHPKDVLDGSIELGDVLAVIDANGDNMNTVAKMELVKISIESGSLSKWLVSKEPRANDASAFLLRCLLDATADEGKPIDMGSISLAPKPAVKPVKVEASVVDPLWRVLHAQMQKKSGSLFASIKKSVPGNKGSSSQTVSMPGLTVLKRDSSAGYGIFAVGLSAFIVAGALLQDPEAAKMLLAAANDLKEKLITK